MIDELAELIEMHNRGVWSTHDLYHQITLLVPGHPLEAILAELPPGICHDFVSWLRETCDNEIPVGDFVSIRIINDREQMRDRHRSA